MNFCESLGIFMSLILLVARFGLQQSEELADDFRSFVLFFAMWGGFSRILRAFGHDFSGGQELNDGD